MLISRRFINFALFLGLITAASSLGGCKGRTMENMEPTGDTVEVVITTPADEVSSSPVSIQEEGEGN